MENMHFHIAHTKISLRTTLFPIEELGTHEKLSCEGAAQGRLNWKPGYWHMYIRIEKESIETYSANKMKWVVLSRG